MSTDIEARLREAFDLRAGSTATSPDGWARIDRRVARRAHRRSLVLRSVAAAAIVVLAVGGGVALFRDDGTGTTASTSRSTTEVGADAGDGGAGGGGAGGGGAAGGAAEPRESATQQVGRLDVRRNADGSIDVQRRRGSLRVGPVAPGGLAAGVEEGVVFGVVPSTAGSVRITADTAPGVTKVASAELVESSDGVKTFVIPGFGGVTGPISVEAGGATTLATEAGGP